MAASSSKQEAMSASSGRGYDCDPGELGGAVRRSPSEARCRKSTPFCGQVHCIGSRNESQPILLLMQWRKKGEGREAAAHPVWGVVGSLRGWVGWLVVGSELRAVA